MARTVYIDISAKLEEWTADSVVAMTNGGEIVLIVPASIKRKARDWLKEIDRKRRKESIYIYRLLAVLVYLVVGPELRNIDNIIIDNDYPGDDPAAKIKNELVPLLRRKRADFLGKRVQFQQVKGQQADRLARAVFQNRKRSWRMVTLEEIQESLRNKNKD